MGFWELLVIAVVALLVLGPERLPGAIRSTVKTVRSIKQFGQQMQAELNDNLRVHELHQKLKDAEAKGLVNLTAEETAALKELTEAANAVRPASSAQATPLPVPTPETPAPTAEETAVNNENKTGS
ncbi:MULTISPECIES: Sec-independent protein translocase protein TatB [Alishewanella]|uniref:Sec-independent translocase n=1 Tax=Alishewanella aestuarii B11 TaxID=1197174 RepID=J1Q0C1_9ALTE|nr:MULTISPECIES: Sec-independent protein translocase protein TatB [Alishewanella]EJI84458.1 sec-independent translocase [Alishewanella aestuarii B11]OCW98062.1 twin arginine-targeting protein translocase TatB [Alishewanella sp. HH-ZS]